MKVKQILGVAAISVVTTLATGWGISRFEGNNSYHEGIQNGEVPANYASFVENAGNSVAGQVDFTAAATASTPAVVHIKTRTASRTVNQERRSPFGDDPFGGMFGDIFGDRRSMTIPEQRASGSGVLISKDGYIVTNNHVVENADDINVTLTNKRSYKAELVGTDPNSDLAVIKIKGENLPYIMLGNSDEVKLGQWVLAIGYPWTLDVTVTAGIVSAKARSLEINSRRDNDSPIESFIQTDAAVNQGNSGGALVDTEGRLVGINSAIASQTGSYAGYSYAIPVNIVKKISGDLVKYGTVQRAYLGINYIPEARAEEYFRQEGISRGDGVYVSDVTSNGAANAAGIRKGDYIVAINNSRINTGSEMVEVVANYKPGDKINVTYARGGVEKTVSVTLKNSSGNYDLVKSAAEGKGNNLRNKLGGELKDIDENLASRLNVEGGVRVVDLGDGLLSTTKMQKDFVITSLNSKPVKNVDDLIKQLSAASGTVRLEGVYPGFEGVYGYPLNLNSRQNNGNQ